MSEVHPVFVGGSGRSGTTITGALIASHPRFAGVPFEVRVHTLTRFAIRGDTSADQVRRQALARYESHLHRVIDSGRFNELLDRYLAQPADAATSREFVEGIMAAVTEQQGKPSWVEMTPFNAMIGSWLHELFPDMRLVHVHRDGRDVAVSTSRTWRRHSVPEALDFWAKRVDQIAADMARLPDGSAMSFRFEDLAYEAREATFQQLVEFLEIDEAAELREFYETHLRPDKAHIGRWAEDLESAERSALDAQYRRLLEQLRARGIEWVADPATVS